MDSECDLKERTTYEITTNEKLGHFMHVLRRTKEAKALLVGPLCAVNALDALNARAGWTGHFLGKKWKRNSAKKIFDKRYLSDKITRNVHAFHTQEVGAYP